MDRFKIIKNPDMEPCFAPEEKIEPIPDIQGLVGRAGYNSVGYSGSFTVTGATGYFGVRGITGTQGSMGVFLGATGTQGQSGTYVGYGLDSAGARVDFMLSTTQAPEPPDRYIQIRTKISIQQKIISKYKALYSRIKKFRINFY
jgi:hypothetical protein